MDLNLPAGLIDRYRIDRELGRGANGVVYLARQLALDRPVAIKVLLRQDPEGRRRFEREARVLASLDHPGIVTVVDFGSEDSCSYLVQAFERGESLDEWLARGAVRSWVDAARVALDLVRALQVVHAAGVVHRDIKPSNVLVTEDGHAKLLDFGVAHLIEGERLTLTSEFVGTPAYASPEQIRGQELGAYTDLYAVGILLCEMLTGVNPLLGPNLADTINRHLNVPVEELPPVTPRLPPQLVGLVVQMLAKSPSMRPSGAEEVSTRLAELLSGGGRTASSGSSRRPGTSRAHPERRATPGGTKAWRIAAGLGTLSAVLIAVGLLARPGGGPTRPDSAPVPAPARLSFEVAVEAALQGWSSPGAPRALDPLFHQLNTAPPGRRTEVFRAGLSRNAAVQALHGLRRYETELPGVTERLAHRPQLLARLAAAAAELSKLELLAAVEGVPVPEAVVHLRALPGMTLASMSLQPSAVRSVVQEEVELYSEDLRLGLPDRASRWSGRLRLDLPTGARRLVLRAALRRGITNSAYVRVRIRSLAPSPQPALQVVNLFPLCPADQDKSTVFVALLPSFLGAREVEVSMELAFLPVGGQVGRIGVGPLEILAADAP